MSDVLAASLQVATALIASMSASEQEHEETLTGTLLGSLLASNTLLSLFTAHLEVAVSQCWWGSYSKSRAKKMDNTEAGSGADFALLTLPKDGGARLAIFQAKRGARKNGEWLFNANRVPNPPKKDDAPLRSPQMVVLVETARRLSKLADPNSKRPQKHQPVTATAPTTQKQIREANLGDFDWIHYLVYTADGTSCIALRYLSRAYLKERGGDHTKTEVPLNENCISFHDVISRGDGPDASHWLEFEDAAVAIAALPHLLPLIPVIVGDGTGTRGPLIQAHAALQPLKLDLGGGALQDIVSAVFAEPGSPGRTPPRHS